VDSDGDAPRAGGDVVASQSALMPLVESSGGIQSERVRRDDASGEQVLTEVHCVMNLDRSCR
jgi:hypothetical protein